MPALATQRSARPRARAARWLAAAAREGAPPPPRRPLLVQAVGVNRAAVEEARAGEEAERAEKEALLDFIVRGKGEDELGKLLIEASEAGNVAAVRRVLKEGAAMDAADEADDTALIYAANDGHEAVVRALLEAGAAPNKRDINGWTALHFADSVSVARLLLEAGADASLRTNGGETAQEFTSAGLQRT